LRVPHKRWADRAHEFNDGARVIVHPCCVGDPGKRRRPAWRRERRWGQDRWRRSVTGTALRREPRRPPPRGIALENRSSSASPRWRGGRETWRRDIGGGSRDLPPVEPVPADGYAGRQRGCRRLPAAGSSDDEITQLILLGTQPHNCRRSFPHPIGRSHISRDGVETLSRRCSPRRGRQNSLPFTARSYGLRRQARGTSARLGPASLPATRATFTDRHDGGGRVPRIASQSARDRGELRRSREEVIPNPPPASQTSIRFRCRRLQVWRARIDAGALPYEPIRL
jgi:hypothetical protein